MGAWLALALWLGRAQERQARDKGNRKGYSRR